MRNLFCFLFLLAVFPKVATCETSRFCADEWNCLALKTAADQKDWQVINAPMGVSINKLTGVLSWKPTLQQLGKYEIELNYYTGKSPCKKIIGIDVGKLKKALFIFAHGDDEFCIMGKLNRLADKGVQIKCLWTASSGTVRKKESTAAMTKIGLEKKDLIFADWAKLDSGNGLIQTIDRLAEIIKKGDFDQIYVNAYEAGHPQHDLTNFVTVQAVAKAKFVGQLYEFGLYNFYGNKPNMFSLVPASNPTIEIVLSDEELKFFESLVPIYKSQKMVTNAFLYAMSKDQKTHTKYRIMPKWDYTRQPHKGKLWQDITPRRGKVSFTDGVTRPVKEFFKNTQKSACNLYEQDRSPSEIDSKIFKLGLEHQKKKACSREKQNTP